MSHRQNPPDLYHHTTAEKAARIFREQRLRSAGEPDVYVTTADYDIGYGPVAVPIYVPAKMLQLDDEFPDGRKDYRIRTKGGSAPVYAGKPFPVRKPNPAGRRTMRISDLPDDVQEQLHNEVLHWAGPEGERRMLAYRYPVRHLPLTDVPDAALNDESDWEMARSMPDVSRMPPIIILNGRLYDGNHRVAAAHMQGKKTIAAIVLDDAGVVMRKFNPAGRLLQFPLREIRVEAFPSPLSNGWLLRLHINGQDVKDAVRDIKTGQARVFDSSAKAAAWWKKHGQAFVDAMGRAACVRTRKANRPGGRRQAAGGRQGNPAGSPFAAEVARLRSDPTLQSASMRQHLRNVAKAPGSGRPRRSAAAREWKEFAGYEPNHVEKIDGVALKGNLPGVRVDVLEGVGAKTGRRVKIDAGQKPLYLVWFKSGERFAVTGGPSAMRELARDFSRLNEPIYLTKVDYVAPRYPVPEGVRRTKANAELSIAFTHAVENPTLMTWNGKLDPRHARFDIRVKGRRRRWVNRSGLIF